MNCLFDLSDSVCIQTHTHTKYTTIFFSCRNGVRDTGCVPSATRLRGPRVGRVEGPEASVAVVVVVDGICLCGRYLCVCDGVVFACGTGKSPDRHPPHRQHTSMLFMPAGH